MIFTIPWENIVTVASLGTVSRATGYLVAGFWLVTVVVTGRFRELHAFHGAVFLFVLWNIISTFWSVNIDRTVARFQTSLQLAGMVFLLWDLYTTPAALRAGLQAYVLGGYVSIASTIINYFTDNAFYFQRYAATGFNVNDLGIILALGMPVAWHLTMPEDNTRRSLVLRIVNYAYIPAAIVAILLTASRSALFATLPALLFMLGSLTQLKPYLRALIIVVLVGSLFALQPLIPQSAYHRLAATGNEVTEGDLNGRLEIWGDGLVSFAENPILGIGSGAFAEITDTGKIGHNFALSLLVEIGIIGFAFFALALGIVFYQAWQQPKWTTRFWLAIMAIWLWGAATHNLEYRKQTWLFLTLIVVGAGIYHRRDETASLPGLPATSKRLPRQPFPRPEEPAALTHTRSFSAARGTSRLPRVDTARANHQDAGSVISPRRDPYTKHPISQN
jgi:O-antigen ligase